MAKDRKIDMVILGLLSHEDMTGYDIKKNIDHAIRFFWKGSFGSIYPALAAMEKDELVSHKAQEEKSGGRERIFYQITEKGRKTLCDWLEDRAAVNDLKYETLLKLFFGSSVDSTISIKNIEEFRRGIEDDLKLLRLYRDNLETILNERDHVYFYITVLFGIETYEGYLRWCDKSIEILRKM